MNFIKILYKLKPLRSIARKLGQNLSIGQKFYTGKIYLHAIQHKWAYLNDIRFQTHDEDLQKYIINMSSSHEIFIDIGCNIGVMTIATLLHNKGIKVVAIDPSKTAIKLLGKSLKANKLNDRATITCAAIGTKNGCVFFNDNHGSLMAHIDNRGDEVLQMKFSDLLNDYKDNKTLVKIDTEGFENIILQDLENVKNLQNFTFIIEVHPINYFSGNPSNVFDLLNKNKAVIKTLTNENIEYLLDNEITQILVNFPNQNL